MLDGTTFTDAISNTSQNLPTVDALEEFRVLTDSYGAEYGRADGSVILAVTKSGTNQFHGSLWEYLRNDALDAANAFTPAGTRKPMLRQNQFGGDIGGPIILPTYNGQNKTFFFFAYEGLRIHQQSLTVAFPLTAAQRNGDFSALLPSQVIKDPATGLPYSGNIVPSNQIDSVATTVLKHLRTVAQSARREFALGAGRPHYGKSVHLQIGPVVRRARSCLVPSLPKQHIQYVPGCDSLLYKPFEWHLPELRSELDSYLQSESPQPSTGLLLAA